MKRAAALCLALLTAGAPYAAATGPGELVDRIDPFIGTGGHGHTFPGPALPFGMVQLGPDTRLTGWDGCSGYHFSDTVVYGFSHTHLSGTGVSDYGDVLLMPVVGEPSLESGEPDRYEEGYASPFDKETERAAAGYYAVRLRDIDLGAYRFSTLLVDPPRAGLDATTLALAKTFRNIFYISCNPQTLKNNLLALNETHRVAEFAVFDQFPGTRHLECGALLVRR